MDDSRVSTEKVWNLLSASLGRFIRSRVSDEQVASDLLQETFLRVHNNLDGIQDQQRITSWVFQVARNLIIDHYRSSRKNEPVVDGDPEEEFNDQGNINEQVAGWLPFLIELLPDPYREPVRLYEIDGIPQKEIAERLGLSLSGAKSRVQRGRQQLRKILSDCCTFDLDRRGNVLDYRPNADPDCCGPRNPTNVELRQKD